MQCQDHLPSNHKEPLQAKPRPTRPFQEAAADLCSHAGRNYLVWVDCCSDWPIITPMHNNTTGTHLTAVWTEILGQTAAPDILWMDGSPQFTSRVFQDFLHQWGVQHRRSTPKQWEGRGNRKSYEEDNQSSMERMIFGQDYTMPSPYTIS